MKSYSLFHLRFVGLALLLSLSSPAMAQVDDAIDTVNVSLTSSGSRIDILFNAPTQYLGHTPKNKGRQLFVDVRLTDLATEELPFPQDQQLRFKSSAQSPLSLINYRSSGSNIATVELDFSSDVRFSVKQSSDFRGITIILLTDIKQGTAAIIATPKVEKQAKALMKRAKKALIDERNFAAASGYYQQVLKLAENSQSKDALEFLGLSYERQGEHKKAQKIYQKYLARYPYGDGSKRVGQRLMSLMTATSPEQKKLRRSKQQEGGWDFYGGLSQSYLYDSINVDTDNGSAKTTSSAISSSLNLDTRKRSATADTRVRLAASHFKDLDSTRSSRSNNDIRYSSFYVEHRDRVADWWVKAGRQRSSHDGVLSRFDGVKLGYSLFDDLELSVVAGFPVASTADSFDSERSFFGAALDFGPYADNWEFSLYLLEQQVDALVDRRALGGEVRYFTQDLTVLGMLDYDAFHSEINIARLLTNWTLKNKTAINASADIRKLPGLSTSNALQGQITTSGQAVQDIAELRTLYSDDLIYQLARDRTAEATTITLGASHPVSETLRIASDLSVMNISETQTSGGVAATPAINNEYALNLQMIGNGILNGDDFSSMGLRYSRGSTAENKGIYASSRLPLNDQWRIYPRITIDQRQWKTIDQSELRLAPSVRLDYRLKNVQFEMELGIQLIDRDVVGGSEKESNLHGSVGYHFEF